MHPILPHASPSAALQRLTQLADQCVMCGLCLPQCPTYQRDREEGSGPRGRIALVRLLAQAAEPVSARAAAQLDGCLSCLRCATVCPAKVNYGALIDGARAQWLAPKAPVRRWLALARHPLLVHALLGLARTWSRLGGWLPAPARRAVAGLEPRPVAYSGSKAATMAQAPPRPLVVILPGCGGLALEPGAVAALGHLLRAAGVRWRLAPAQCCGALQRHAGLPAPAARLAQRHFGALSTWPADAVLLGWASGCQRQLQDTAPAGRVVQSSLDWAAGMLPQWLQMQRPDRPRIALWTACSQGSQAGDANALWRLLQAVEGVEAVPLQASGCCGAAGFRHLLEPAQVDPLTDAVLDAALAARCAVLVSANPGCVHALRSRASERQLDLEVQQVYTWLMQARLTLRDPVA